MGSPNMEYLYWLHKFYSERGYCSTIVPTFKIQIGKGGVQYRSARFHTYTFNSLSWLYELFYIDKVKIMPSNIMDYLTPLALAIWIMDDGGKHNAGVMISTYNFTYEGLLIVKAGLFNKYGLVVEIKKFAAGYVLVFMQSEMKTLVSLVSPFFIPSMLYKLHGNRYLS
uniref:LAGLIDADG endonuclease n=1 Tax=Powellomyces hirtus TaxID=109895 RepID=A0A4V1F1X0_9FUNG|nr:LAGLIDADG endonuclease [Powellomyces hirtus]